jgi:very-short-patch-repair endonuclease
VTSSLVRRRRLRRASPPAETALWYHLRDRRLAGVKFRRQQAWGPFILDFFCWEQRLAIELDGGQHFEAMTEAYDARRTAFLRRQGIRVLRFSNDQVFNQRRAVLAEIARAVGVEEPSP